jgi:hypothetical protein
LKEDAFLLSKLGVVACAHCRYDQFRAEEAERLPARAIPLFSFVSSQPLQDCLKVTAPHELLETVQAMVMASLRQTPVRTAPHGFTSVGVMLHVAH